MVARPRVRWLRLGGYAWVATRWWLRACRFLWTDASASAVLAACVAWESDSSSWASTRRTLTRSSAGVSARRGKSGYMGEVATREKWLRGRRLTGGEDLDVERAARRQTERLARASELEISEGERVRQAA